jgi:tripartite ATP-independent transporter DctP family solute receptor
MKKALAILLALSVAASLSAGGKQDGAKAEEKPVTLRLAETHPLDYATTRGDLEFARLVKERTNGRITVEVYPSAQLGEEKAAIEQVQFGAIDFTRVSVSPVAAFAPLFNALQLPYIFRDSDHEWKVLNGAIGDELLASLESANFVGLCWYDSGARNFYNSKREVKTPADLKGLKIRVQQSDLMVSMVNSLGAVATPMAYGEVYSGLQTGVIEGAENNWPSYDSTSHFEVAKYYTIDEHTRVPEVLMASKISMDKLSKADQDIIKKAAKDSMPFQIAEWKAFEKVSEKKVRDAGCVITEIKDKSAFQAAMQPLYEKQPANILALVKRIQEVK